MRKVIKSLLGLGNDDFVPRGTILGECLGDVKIGDSGINDFAENINTDKVKRNTILENNYFVLSMKTTRIHLQGVLVGFIFIALFDHYFWDIWPGQVIFWLVAGIIAGLDRD